MKWRGLKEQEGSTEEDPYPSPSLLSKEGWDLDKIYGCNSYCNFMIEKIKTKTASGLEKPLVSLFDYNLWNQPFLYIKNNRFGQAVITEMSQYLFDTCNSDGKQIISFEYLPTLWIFWENDKKKGTPIVTPEYDP